MDTENGAIANAAHENEHAITETAREGTNADTGTTSESIDELILAHLNYGKESNPKPEPIEEAPEDPIPPESEAAPQAPSAENDLQKQLDALKQQNAQFQQFFQLPPDQQVALLQAQQAPQQQPAQSTTFTPIDPSTLPELSNDLFIDGDANTITETLKQHGQYIFHEMFNEYMQPLTELLGAWEPIIQQQAHLIQQQQQVQQYTSLDNKLFQAFPEAKTDEKAQAIVDKYLQQEIGKLPEGLRTNMEVLAYVADTVALLSKQEFSRQLNNEAKPQGQARPPIVSHAPSNQARQLDNEPRNAQDMATLIARQALANAK